MQYFIIHRFYQHAVTHWKITRSDLPVQCRQGIGTYESRGIKQEIEEEKSERKMAIPKRARADDNRHLNGLLAPRERDDFPYRRRHARTLCSVYLCEIRQKTWGVARPYVTSRGPVGIPACPRPFISFVLSATKVKFTALCSGDFSTSAWLRKYGCLRAERISRRFPAVATLERKSKDQYASSFQKTPFMQLALREIGGKSLGCASDQGDAKFEGGPSYWRVDDFF